MGSPQTVEENSLQIAEAGNRYQVKLRLNWYRSLPLSCVQKIALAVDGKPVNPANMRFGINQHEYKLDELADRVEEFWFVQDSAILSVHEPGSVLPGETHKIDLELTLRFPYIPIGPGKFLTNVNKYSATQVAGSSEEG